MVIKKSDFYSLNMTLIFLSIAVSFDAMSINDLFSPLMNITAILITNGIPNKNDEDAFIKITILCFLESNNEKIALNNDI